MVNNEIFFIISSPVRVIEFFKLFLLEFFNGFFDFSFIS